MTKYKLQIFFFSVILIFFTNIGHTQVGLNFQGVARKNDNSIISSQLISIKLSILQGAFESNIEYSEVRSVMTNAQGLFVVVIGDTGAISTLGNFNNTNWKQSPKFLKIEMDPEGGDNFITMGTTQFQYVAYAKFASSVDAENIIGTIPVKSGGTGYTSLLDLKKALVLDKLNNTADLEKPISTLTKSALDLKLNLTDSIKFVKKTYTDSLLLTKLNLSDTSKMISNRIAKDTLNLSYRINFKEDVSNKSTDINLGGSTPSDTLYPSQKAVRSYITSNAAGIVNEVIRATDAENALDTRIASNTVSITSNTNAIASNTASITISTNNIASNTLSISTLKSSLVPYSGATGAVNLGAYDLTVNGITIGTGPLGVASYNLLFGDHALNSNTTGAANTAIGAGSLMNNTSGYRNFALGAGSLMNNTEGNWNVGLGINALNSNSIGNYNFGIGSSSLYKNIDGNYNVAIGNKALFENLHSSNNVAIGSDALLNALGEDNTAIGISALAQNGITSHNGTRNTAIGRYTDISADDVQNSTVIGYGAVVGASNTIQLGNNEITNVNTSGSLTVNSASPITLTRGLGFNSIFLTNIPSFGFVDATIAIGDGVLANNTTGNTNIAIGALAMNGNKEGSNNLAIGNQALSNNEGGVMNTIIGNGADVSDGNLSNASAIGFGAQVSSNNTIQLGNSRVTNVNTNGTITAGEVTYPNLHGTNGQLLISDGSSNLIWSPLSSMLTSSNTFIGTTSIGFGTDALLNNTSNGNTAVGYNAMFSNEIGNENTAIGTYSLNNNRNGIYNTAVGAGSLTSNLTGDRNTAIGNRALKSNDSGIHNTAIGVESLNSNITGNYNTAIGSYADVSDNLQNAIVIGSYAKATSSNTIQLGNRYITNVNTSGTFTSGGIISKFTQIGDHYTILSTDDIIIASPSISSSKTITLPNASSVSGRTYLIKRMNTTGTITIAAAASDTIDGVSTFVLSARYKYVKVVSDGTNWIIVGNN